MKIIKQGKLPEQSKQITCKKCETVYSYTRADVLSDFRDQAEWVRCPVCNLVKVVRHPQQQTNRMDD